MTTEAVFQAQEQAAAKARAANPTQAQAATSRQPRGLVRVNSVLVPWLEWSVDNNTYYRADTFRCTLPISGLPQDRAPAWWGSTDEIQVEIFAGFPTNPARFAPEELRRLILGQVDEVSVELESGVIRLAGRDLTARLIDSRTTEKWQNQTASEIATALATKEKLTPKVVDTGHKVGAFYQIDHARLTDQQSEWDLLAYLAKEEGYVCYVTGTELHFEPRPDTDKIKPYALKWTPATPTGSVIPRFDGKSLHLTRALTIARGVKVIVRTWSPKAKKTHTETAETQKSVEENERQSKPQKAAPVKSQSAKGLPGGSRGAVQTYVYTFPNLTPEQALQKAQALLKEISAHERKLMVTAPADNDVSCQAPIELQGTGTSWDQKYYVDSIEREMSMHAGYVMTIHAKNHSPDNEIAI